MAPLFENNGTLQKWHMTDTPHEIDKNDNNKDDALYKWHDLRKNVQSIFSKD